MRRCLINGRLEERRAIAGATTRKARTRRYFLKNRRLRAWTYILETRMSEKIIAFLVQFVTHVIDMGGYAGIMALMGIESACIPLPSEIIMPFAGYLVYLGRFSLFWAGHGRRNRLQSGFGCGILDWRQRRTAAGGALWALGADEPPRSGPDDGVLSEIWFNCGSAGAAVAGGADLHRLSGRDCQDAAIALSCLYIFGFVAVVLRAGLCGHEAGRGVAYGPALSRGLPPLSPGGRGCSAGGNCVVCVVARKARQAGRGGVVRRMNSANGTAAGRTNAPRRTLFRLLEEGLNLRDDRRNQCDVRRNNGN